LQTILDQDLLAYPWPGDGVYVMAISVELVADVCVQDLLLGAVQVAVQGAAGKVLDAVMHLLAVGRQLDQDVSEQLDHFLVLALRRGGRSREKEAKINARAPCEADSGPEVQSLSYLSVFMICQLQFAKLLDCIDVRLVGTSFGLIEKSPRLS
jgi:hypothetical protein